MLLFASQDETARILEEDIRTIPADKYITTITFATLRDVERMQACLASIHEAMKEAGRS
ncbi:hypothetical protein D3C85_1819280 [compost metagenome]